MASNILLKLTNIDGESKDSTHGDEIELLSFAWALTQSGTASAGGGSSGVAMHIQDMSFTKSADKSTPNLIRYCAAGTPIDEAILTIRKAGNNTPQDFQIFTMTECIISSVQVGGSGDAGQTTESFSINFAKIHVLYKVQKEDGSLEDGPEVTVDIKGSEVS